MLRLLFLTSNRTKMAHMRHLAEGRPVVIEGIKQKSYNKSYSEPRLSSREILLENSYQNALKQAEKALDVENNFFFLEDTSVRIDALSSQEKETPGVDIKYWMRENDFASIDNALKRKGNNRKVAVRSDILLHLPKKHMNRLSLKDDYITFTSFQDGFICESEHTIETNLLFPWLDSQSFNKWFVPDSEKEPISMQPIDIADQYDFRKGAFSDMLSFLEKGEFIRDNSKGLIPMDLKTGYRPKKIIIVCGPTCSGKTTISQHLAKKFGYCHIEASDFMHWHYYIRNGASSRVNIGRFAKTALEAKPHIVAESVVEFIESIRKLHDCPVVISGFRNNKEIDWLKSQYTNDKLINVIVINASRKIRHERFNARKRDGVLATESEFAQLDKEQEEMGLKFLVRNSQYPVVANNKSYEEFFATFESQHINDKVNASSSEEALNLLDAIDVDDFTFEEIVLLTLLSTWDAQESQGYFTTTSIAKICKGIFSTKSKHKDNISRYFNRDYYPLYEIKSDRSKFKYKLSNTGYSKSLLIGRKIVNQKS